MGDIANAKGDGIDVEAEVVERQMLGIAGNERHMLSGFFRPCALGPDTQHFGIGVDYLHAERGRDTRRRTRGAKGDIARAAGNIGHVQRGVRGVAAQKQNFHQTPLPHTVKPARHQIVHQVVARGNRVKNIAHKGLFLRGRHLPETEIG